jgi:arsenite-transporting ATPase
VVDTAPTGHTLRLLDTPDVLRGWLRVFDAMAGKADTVASALVGERVRMSVEGELDTLAEEMAAFEETVASADFLVVTGAGAVEVAETRRLVSTLRERGLTVAGVVAMDRGATMDDLRPDLVFPYSPGVSGCDGLRGLVRDAREDVGGRSSGESAAAGAEVRLGDDARVGAGAVGSSGAFPPELDRSLVVFAGKGGVGKSTCAAAAAVALSERGEVVLMGADPAGSLDDVLAGESTENLEVRELDGDAELERLRTLYAEEVERAFEAIGLDRSARLDRAVVDSLWELAPPGLDELIAVSRLAAEVEAGRRVVLDTAPTGHFLRLVAMPELALDWVRRLMRILIKYGALGELDAPAEQLLRFARRFRALRERLVDGSATAIVVVTLAEPMVRAETDRLVDRLGTLGLPVAGVLVNRATGPVAPFEGQVTWRAPRVEEPRGVTELRHFNRAWERVQ